VLEAENTALKNSANQSIVDLVGLDETVKLWGDGSYGHYVRDWVRTLKWSELFALIAPFLLNHPDERILGSVY